MIRTHTLPCALPRPVADALNLESGRLYTQVLVTHWRVVRKHGQWLRPGTAEKLHDSFNPTKRLHAHTIDAAQQGFYKACTTTKAVKKLDPAQPAAYA